MPFDPEAVTSAGSGLVFLNYYDSSVGSDYRNAIINAEASSAPAKQIAPGQIYDQPSRARIAYASPASMYTVAAEWPQPQTTGARGQLHYNILWLAASPHRYNSV